MSTPIPTTIAMNDFTFRQHRGLQYIVCEPLERAGFKNAFSTRLGGTSPLPEGALSLGNFTRERQGDQREFVLENRQRFTAAIGAADWPLVTAKQIHSADVRSVINYDDALREAEVCDALISGTPQILLAVQTADCLPVLIVDERTKAFAAVHAGWRGTLAGIVARTVERMQREYDSRAPDLRAALGPAICARCFEVGPEVLEAFRKAYWYAEGLIDNEQANGKGHLNINRANSRQLIECGVPATRIHDSRLCTVCRNDLFFSYRRERGHEGHVGRLMGVVGVEG
ncbi:MAG TPA: peptidoglycan editing factor PgeF [Blastocatellia bacterium]|nr:peptidoglycan editing factor PgeF [Blastocatellia bacterium]